MAAYTMGCPPVRGDNRRALANGLSYVQMDNHCITIFTTYMYISVDLEHQEIFLAKVGKGGINWVHWTLGSAIRRYLNQMNV